MGINLSDNRYSFKNQYDVVDKSLQNSGLYKLQNRSTKEFFIGRQIMCNDKKEAYEIQCIIHQKMQNPSPFVTRLLNYQYQHEETYCSNTHNFFLLFKEIPKLLADQIKNRQISGRCFTLSQIDMVIYRGAKGIKYLYDIFHRHEVISSHAFTWPVNQNSAESIQLIDQWAFFVGSRQNRYKNLRPKDQFGVEQKNMQKCIDLGNLGQVAKEMLNTDNGVNVLKGQPGYNNIIDKIQVLTGSYHNRNLIYDMISNNNVTQTIGLEFQTSPHLNRDIKMGNNVNKFSFQKSSPFKQETKENFRKIHHHNQPYQHQKTQPKISPINEVYLRNTIPQSVNSQFINNHRRKINDRIDPVQKTHRPISQVSTKITFNNGTTQRYSKNSSVGKLTLNSREPNINTINSFKSPIQPLKLTSSLSTLSPSISFKKLPETGKITPQPDLNVTLGNTLKTHGIQSYQSPQQIYQYYPSASLPYLNSQNFRKSDYSTILNSTHSYPYLISNNQSIGSITNKSYQTNSSLNGLYYSFGQSSGLGTDQAFFFKSPTRLAASGSQDNLFTSPDFFKKIDQLVGCSKVEPSLEQLSTPKGTLALPLISSSMSQSPPPSSIPVPNIPFIPVAVSVANESNSLQYSLSHIAQGKDTQLVKNELKMIHTASSPPQIGSISSSLQQIDIKKHPKSSMLNMSNMSNKIPTSPPTNIPIVSKMSQNQLVQKKNTNYQKKDIIPPMFEIYNNTRLNPSLQTNPETPNIAIHEKSKETNSIYINDNQQHEEQEFAKSLPIKNFSNQSSQLFNTIPEVSEKSVSARSDEEKDYVIQEYQNGSRYEGYKMNGMRNGKGRFYYQQGSFYDGEWKNNNMHGFGKLYYTSQKLAYEGEWYMDQFHGKGKVYNDDPDLIVGLFDYTNFENLQQKWKNYQGDLLSDSKDGYGKLVLSNDQYYQGQFKNDKISGRGKFVTKRGQIIEGIWENSKLITKF